MEIWPAIDIRGGMCVRLEQGDYRRETVYSQDPVATAREFVKQGARCLHIVDLDGAKAGRAVNWIAIQGIVRAVDVPCELGGGIRDDETIARLLQLGLARLVIGTRAIKEPDWFQRVCEEFPGKLALSLDARRGRVATDGWSQTSSHVATDLARQYAHLPLASLIYTDIQTDGMMSGPNLDALAEIRRAVNLPLVASGGVTTTDDVAALAAIPVSGCILGRALYEGRLTLQQALAAAEESANGHQPVARRDRASGRGGEGPRGNGASMGS